MIYANISSSIGNAKTLENTLESIYYQVDEINLFISGCSSVPIFDSKINVVTDIGPADDNRKFFFLDKVNGFYFTFNDTIIYPPNYVKETLPRFATYPIICYGGKNFRSFPIKSYESSSIDIYHYTNELKKDRYVQFPNTGTMSFHVNDFKINYKMFNEPNMADVIIGCLAKQNGKIISCLKKDRGWIQTDSLAKVGGIEPNKTTYVNENYHK